MFLSPECLYLSGRRQLILGHFLKVAQVKMHSVHKCIRDPGDPAHVSLFSLSQNRVEVGHDGRARQWRWSEWKVRPLWLPSVHRLSTFVKSVHSMHRQSNVLEVYGSPLPPGDSTNSQDGDEDSESNSSDASCSSPSKYNSADFQSSLRGFEMSESKRKRLRELEASAFFKCLDMLKAMWLFCFWCGSTHLL